MKTIDLSIPFDPKLFAALSLSVTHVADGTRSAGMEISFTNHIGTHLDVPSHLVPGGTTVENMPLDRFVGEGVVVNLPRGLNEPVTAQDLEQSGLVADEDDIVFIATGWDAWFGKPEYASHHPYLTMDAAQWLIDRKVRMVGMDVQTVDLGHSLRKEGFSYTSLRALLQAGIPVLHSLGDLTPVHNSRCELSAVPICFTGADGAPTRAFARI